jgi:thymidylate synthase (FAD)
MPTPVEIEIFNIARTQVDPVMVHSWLRHVGMDNFELPSDTDVTDPALIIALAAKRCYMSFEPGLNPNVTRVRKNYFDYLENILASGHGSVLEHSVYTYAIEGVSRVFTAEMNRHRAGWAISEGSLRFIRFDKDIPYWIPTSLRPIEGGDPSLEKRKELSRQAFNNIFEEVEYAYEWLLQIWDMEEGDKNFDYKKKVTSCLRRIVPMGVATGGVWTGNVRALRHVIATRMAPAAEEEIFYVFTKIAEDMIKREPMLFGDFRQMSDGGYVPEHVKV